MMEETQRVETAEDLFRFLSTIPKCVRENLSMDTYIETENSPFIYAIATQIFEDGVPVSFFHIVKGD